MNELKVLTQEKKVWKLKAELKKEEALLRKEKETLSARDDMIQELEFHKSVLEDALGWSSFKMSIGVVDAKEFILDQINEKLFELKKEEGE